MNVDKDTENLIKKLIKGNEKAYMYLIKTYYKKLFLYAYNLSKNQVLAEDIVQNVFMRIWENRKQLNIKESFKSFLYKSVYNEFINNYRKQQSSLALDTIFFDTINTSSDDLSIDNQRLALVYNEIENLPTKCKQVFLLSKKEGLTNQEISEHLNITIKAVENHITNAFSIIRNNLKEDKA
ncbi:RNA polymerase sigma factor [Wenyingzhuangia marina]|nr:RNA polymerase sigma-70 factor [Wenyingzhuangia marina]